MGIAHFVLLHCGMLGVNTCACPHYANPRLCIFAKANLRRGFKFVINPKIKPLGFYLVVLFWGE
jgi:hypothetical protein